MTTFAHLDCDSLPDADAMAELFKMLANETRLRMLHAIHRAGQARPSDLADDLDLSPQVVSNQLRRLADQRIVVADRDGREQRYRIIDPCVPGLLDLAVCLLAERPPR